jgi:hypothetical protein
MKSKNGSSRASGVAAADAKKHQLAAVDMNQPADWPS